MSSKSDISKVKADNSNEKEIRRKAISKLEIQPIKYSDSPNLYKANDTVSNNIATSDSPEPSIFTRVISKDTSNPSYQVSDSVPGSIFYSRLSPKFQRKMASYNVFSSTDEIGCNEFGRVCSPPISFRTRLDFGTGFKMRIMSSGTDNLNQSATISSEAPLLKNARIVDAPFNLTQRTMLSFQPKSKKSPRKAMDSNCYTATQPLVTPQLSYGTYGWARIPHTKTQKSPRSPKKAMDVRDKKKTIPTPIRRLRNIRTYRESPPPITISKDGRPRGIFSPKSVYKRQLLSRRNLFGNESPSGSGTWHDSDDYGHHDQDKSVERSDHSLPWETPEKFDHFAPRRYNPQPLSTTSTKSSARSRKKYSPMTQVTSSSPYSLPQSSPEELDWSGLFSPESTDPSPNLSQRLFEPNRRKRYVSESIGKKLYFQPSIGFIPRTL